MKDARHPIWWLRRIATAPTPSSSARAQASETARAVTQMPGRRRASQHAEAPREVITSGSPSTAISPGFDLLDVLREEREPVGGMSVEVRFDQALGDHRRLVPGHAGGVQRAGRERPKVVRVESGRGVRSLANSRTGCLRHVRLRTSLYAGKQAGPSGS